MASVNDLILESNVRERLYPAMPFKILQIYMKTANRYAYASCFSGNIFPKRKRKPPLLKWSMTVHKLPEEGYREVHESGLEPYGNELGTRIFKQDCGN